MASPLLMMFMTLSVIVAASMAMAICFGAMMRVGERIDSDNPSPDTCRTCALTNQERLDSYCRVKRRETDGQVRCEYRKKIGNPVMLHKTIPA